MSSIYRHYKGGHYSLVGVAKHTETGEPLVVYKSINLLDTTLWVRPLAMFQSMVTVDGKQTPRFQLVEGGGDNTCRLKR
jgi:hypothetical protein